MIAFSLGELADLLGSALVGVSDPAVRPVGVVRIDSRDVEVGDVFACVRGDDVDGHDFAASAVEHGAVLSLASRPVAGPHVVVDDVPAALALLSRATVERRPAMTVVGITGSSGKTSTKDLLAQVLEAVGPTVSPPGSLNNELGLPMTVLRTDDTTRFLVLEMGARGIGHIRDLCAAAPPHVGVVLNVGSAHVGEFGGREAIALAKGELVEALPADGVAVLNADDDLVHAMATRTAARVVTFGEGEAADIRAVAVSLDDSGRASFELRSTLVVGAVRAAPVALRLVGRHHVSNALAAAAAALALGVPLSSVAAALSSAEPRSRWRMEVTATPGGGAVVNDAYNANPESMRAALDALVALAGARRTWAVLGEMRELGAGSDAAHRALGARAVELGLDRVVVVGDAARAIAEGAHAAGAAPGTVDTVADPEAAAALVEAAAGPSDVVLVKASRAVGLESVAAALLDGTGALR